MLSAMQAYHLYCLLTFSLIAVEGLWSGKFQQPPNLIGLGRWPSRAQMSLRPMGTGIILIVLGLTALWTEL